MVKIGKSAFETAVPDDLDSRLVALTGLNAERMREKLERSCSSAELAAALEPMLVEPVHRVELARLIARADAEDVRRQLAALYAGKPAPKKERRGAKAKG